MFLNSLSIIMLLCFSSDEFISGIDPIYYYLDNPAPLVDEPVEPVFVIYRIRADFTGDGIDDVLLTDNTMYEEEVYAWHFYECKETGFIVRQCAPACDLRKLYVGTLDDLDTVSVVKFYYTGEKQGNLGAYIWDGDCFTTKLIRRMDLTKPENEEYLNGLFSNTKSYYEILKVKDLPLNLLPEKYKKISSPQQEGELDTQKKAPSQKEGEMADSSSATVSPPLGIPKTQLANQPVSTGSTPETLPLPQQVAFPSSNALNHLAMGRIGMIIGAILLVGIILLCWKTYRRKT